MLSCHTSFVAVEIGERPLNEVIHPVKHVVSSVVALTEINK